MRVITRKIVKVSRTMIRERGNGSDYTDPVSVSHFATHFAFDYHPHIDCIDMNFRYDFSNHTYRSNKTHSGRWSRSCGCNLDSFRFFENILGILWYSPKSNLNSLIHLYSSLSIVIILYMSQDDEIHDHNLNNKENYNDKQHQ
jgi:hypothetical protein